jgi:uncharacterized membrane protein YphA (DoxX/SURF4 family)
MPSVVRRLIMSAAIWLAARVALALPFVASGLLKAANFEGAVAEVAGLGVPAPSVAAALTILVQLAGSILLFTPLLWLGAGMLAVFTAIATVLAHAFWSVPADLRIPQLMIFLEHAAIAGGFAAAAIAAFHRRAA